MDSRPPVTSDASEAVRPQSLQAVRVQVPGRRTGHRRRPVLRHRPQPAARRLLIEAGGTVRTTQQTLRMRAATRAAERRKLALSLRARYEAGATLPELAQECTYSVATVYRLPAC
jgi:hypothetical protein